MSNNYYSSEYIPGIVKWGKITLLLGIILSFGPIFVLSVVWGYMPPLDALISALVSQLSVCIALYVVEPISYFPILGIPGTYVNLLSGNGSNMRIPCSLVAQASAGVEPGTEKGSVIATLGITVSVVVNIVILSIGVIVGSTLLSKLPPEIKSALNLILPALFGAVFGQFAVNKPKIAAVAMTIAVIMTLLVKKGVFSFLPGNPSYLITLTAVFGTIIIGKKLEELKEVKSTNS